MIWLTSVLIIWTIYSVWWFWMHIGDKHRKEKWYDLPIMIPTLIIAYTVGGIFRLHEFIFGEKD